MTKLFATTRPLISLACTFVAWTTLVACDGDDAMVVAPDASPTIDALTMCPAQTATPLPSGAYKLYLATEGVDLVKGACDDSQTNCTSLITQSQTVPPFYENDSSRASSISVIAGYVQRSLAPYSIDVVLERPTSGDYYMVVMGGDPTTLTGVPNVAGVAPGVCDTTHRNGVSLAFDNGANSPTYYANTVLSNFGAMLGMAVVAQKNDCMCRAGTICQSTNEFTCAWGVDVPVAPDVHSCGRTTQDEPLYLMTALGCR
jgi:hypothetical protein